MNGWHPAAERSDSGIPYYPQVNMQQRHTIVWSSSSACRTTIRYVSRYHILFVHHSLQIRYDLGSENRHITCLVSYTLDAFEDSGFARGAHLKYAQPQLITLTRFRIRVSLQSGKSEAWNVAAYLQAGSEASIFLRASMNSGVGGAIR